MTKIHQLGDGCPYHGAEPHLSEVMTTTQLASYLDVTPARVKRWAELSESTRFPQPAGVFGRANVYTTTEVTAWCEKWFSTRDWKKPDTIGRREVFQAPSPEPTKTRVGDQPLPDPTAAIGASIQSQVIADMEERRRVGIERYGTELFPFNGRDMLQDAYEESLDKTVYLKGCIIERDFLLTRLEQLGYEL